MASAIKGKLINVSSGIKISITFENRIENKGLDLSFYLKNTKEVIIVSKGLFVASKNEIRKGTYTVVFEIPPFTLNEDSYYFEMFWGINRSEIAYKCENSGFEVLNIENAVGEIIKSPGILFPNINYTIE